VSAQLRGRTGGFARNEAIAYVGSSAHTSQSLGSFVSGASLTKGRRGEQKLRSLWRRVAKRIAAFVEFTCLNRCLTESVPNQFRDMPAYKKQHYLPAAYLKYFSLDQATCSRDSWTWRFDGKTQRPVAIVSQCSGDYHYSKSNPAEAERTFQEGEAIYCQCIDRIRSGKTLSAANYGSLLVMMFDFFIRNNIHKNRTGGEEIQAYRIRSHNFLRQLLLSRPSGEVTHDEIIEHVARNWTVRIFPATPGQGFITSDNPSAWASLRLSPPGLHMVTLPITPKLVAVAIDRRIAYFTSDRLVPEDVVLMNCSQVQNAEKCVFSFGPLTDDTKERIRDTWAQISRTPGEVHENSWRLSLQTFLPGFNLSFLRRTPPIF
jgi:hypothetical protein